MPNIGISTKFSGEQDSRGLSYDLWSEANIPLFEIRHDKNKGIIFEDDFTGEIPIDNYTATQATAGTFAFDPTALGGVALADCNSTTATQGINVQLASGSNFQVAAGYKLGFEARVKAADIATGPEFFLGLAVLDTTVIATSALSAQAIGFKSVTDDGVLLATCKDGSGETTASSIHTLVDDTWVRLGFFVDGTSRVRFFVNGVRAGVITANIPTSVVRPTLVCQSGGTTDPIVHIDHWCAAQTV